MHYSLGVFLRALADAWKGHNSGSPRVWLLGFHANDPIGSLLDLLNPLGSSWCGFCMCHSGCVPNWRSYLRAKGLLCGHCCHSEASGEKSVGGGGTVFGVQGASSSPCRSALV
jgi:hypothetical protein